jgi:hypothetical protein
MSNEPFDLSALTPVDIDGDGQVDAAVTELDINGDGMVDTIAADINMDGVVDAALVDVNGDMVPDVAVDVATGQTMALDGSTGVTDPGYDTGYDGYDAMYDGGSGYDGIVSAEGNMNSVLIDTETGYIADSDPSW